MEKIKLTKQTIILLVVGTVMLLFMGGMIHLFFSTTTINHPLENYNCEEISNSLSTAERLSSSTTYSNFYFLVVSSQEFYKMEDLFVHYKWRCLE